jgi:nucleoid DNA-binding protein
MRKAEIVQRIAQELGCTTTKAEGAVEAILTMIKASLQQGDPVILRRFGTWAGPRQAGACRPQPQDGRRGRHSRPAGRALPRGPAVQAGRRWGCPPRRMSRATACRRRPTHGPPAGHVSGACG